MTDAYAVITPDGELSWYPLSRAADVEALVGGTVAPGALDTVTVAGPRIPGRGPLKAVASDIGALFPGDYPLNPLAGLVIADLSGGRHDQAWHGTVALTEYAADPVTREVLWPGEMSPRWIDVVNAAVRRAREELSGNPAPKGSALCRGTSQRFPSPRARSRRSTTTTTMVTGSPGSASMTRCAA